MEQQQSQAPPLDIMDLQILVVAVEVHRHAMQLFLIPMFLYGTQLMVFLSELMAVPVVLA
jgi:hypothetical protein